MPLYTHTNVQALTLCVYFMQRTHTHSTRLMHRCGYTRCSSSRNEGPDNGARGAFTDVNLGHDTPCMSAYKSYEARGLLDGMAHSSDTHAHIDGSSIRTRRKGQKEDALGVVGMGSAADNLAHANVHVEQKWLLYA